MMHIANLCSDKYVSNRIHTSLISRIEVPFRKVFFFFEAAYLLEE